MKVHFNIFLIIIAIILIPFFLSAQSVWQVEQLEGKNLDDLAVGMGGSVHVVYTEMETTNPNNNFTDLFYFYRQGEMWSVPLVVSATPEITERDGNICVDANGIAHIVFTKYYNSWCYIFYWNSTPGFGDPVEISPPVGPYYGGDGPNIAVDPQGFLHVAYRSGNPSETCIVYINNISGSFINPLVLDVGVTSTGVSQPSMDVDENGKAGIVYIKNIPVGSELFHKALFTSNAGGNFLSPIEIQANPDSINKIDPDIKVSNGFAYISYGQTDLTNVIPGLDDLYYVRLEESTGNPVFPAVQYAERTSQKAAIDFEPATEGDPAKIHVAFTGFYLHIINKKQSEWKRCINYTVLNADDGTTLVSPETVYRDEIVSEITIDTEGKAHLVFGSYYGTNSVMPQGVMHIASVDVTTYLKGKNVNGVTTVTVVDEYGNPVEGASVSGVWSGLTTDSDIFLTGNNGSGSCNSDKVSKTVSGYFIFTVTDVSKDGWVYDPAANVEDQDSAPWNISQKVLPGETTTVSLTTTELLGNYPNPFNPVTTIRYRLAENQSVKLEIYNLQGQLICTLVHREQQAGEHSVFWDAKSLASGVYLYKLQTGDYIETRKMVLMK